MFTSLKTDNPWKEIRKIKPAYFSDLQKYPKANPLFITVDYRCLHYIRSHYGICLFCKKDDSLSMYDLSFCYKREIWVLYLSPHDYIRAMQLGRRIQLTGATRIRVIAFNSELLGRN